MTRVSEYNELVERAAFVPVSEPTALAAVVGGTSPIVAGGLLYVYDPGGSGLHVYSPTSGAEVADLPAGSGHWNSPIVTDGRIALPEGNANDHSQSGVLDLYRLP